jgi:D-alanine-D-alanine ligase
MKKLKVMMLLHPEMVPPDDLIDPDDPRHDKYRTEMDVKNALYKLGHEVIIVAVNDDIAPVRQAIETWQPDIAFNMLEDFAGFGALDFYIVSYLDMLGVPYTGCNARGLLLSRDKALSKKLLSYHRIRVPKFRVFPISRKPTLKQAARLPYPMIVKSKIEQGSVGIAQSSYVSTPEELIERVKQVHHMTGEDAITEQYIEGRELYVTVLGNLRLEVFPIRELVFDKIDDNMHRIATYNVKWNEEYRERWGIDYQFARHLPEGMAEKIARVAKRVYRVLEMSGYARLDLRLTAEGRIYILEANANAAITSNEDVAFAAEKAGYNYEQLIQKLLNLGLRAHKEHQA